MLKASSERIHDAVESLWEQTASLERGDVIHWTDIEAAVGESRDASPCRVVVLKLKRRYEEERGITLWSVPTVGYRLCTVEQQLLRCSRERVKRAGRQLRRGVRHMQAIPDEELTDAQRSLRADRVNNQKRALRRVRAAGKIEAVLSRPTSSGIPVR